jgi:multidrug resistance efflux pump
MTEQSKKIVVPPFLLRRLEAFRIVKGDQQSYVLRDKLHDRVYDFEPWQFFILEILPNCETFERLQSVFQDRFDRTLTKPQLDELLGSLADNKLYDESAATHPLLAPFTRKLFVIEDGKAKPKPFTGAEATASAPAAAPVQPQAPPDRATELPAGVQDALGMDWRTAEGMIDLFDPRPILKVLAPFLRSLRFLVYPIPLLMVAALFVTFKYSNILIPDLLGLKAHVKLFEHLLFVFATVHIVTTLSAAAVADYYKVSVDSWGMFLTLGFMPRWVLRMTGADRLTRKQTMWLHGATLLARMAMYSLGALIWYNTRDSNDDFAQVGLLFMFSCGLGLLFESGNPFIKANGYFLLSAYLNEPHLRGKAYAALLSKLRGETYKKADSNLLALYALLSTTYILIIIAVVSWVIVKYVFGGLALGGSGVIITASFIAYMLWRNYAGLKRFAATYERQVQFDRWRNRTLQTDAVEGEVKTRKVSYWKRALVVCLIIALFLPYPYEPGGNFTVFPVRKGAITTDTPGVIAQVYFDGGESVKKGTVVARLAHDDYLAQLNVLDAEIEEQKHLIANLKTLPKPEEIVVAVQQLEVAKTHVPFSGDKVKRMEKLYPLGAVTLEELETARKDYEVDKSQVVEKEAALALAKTGPTQEHIATEKSKLVALEQQRAGIADKIDRTVLRMPMDGNILTLHLMDKINSYLHQGEVFADVENTGHVTAQIQVVESDIQYISLGQSVRARPNSFFYDEFDGKVTTIDRNITHTTFGNIVNVIATFDNKQGLMKTGMQGEAKIAAVTMPVWKAFSHSIIKFVRESVWSWIP